MTIQNAASWQNAETGSNKPRSYSGDYMAIGRAGESIVIPWLMSRPGVLEVEDLTEFKPMRKADVDCSIFLNDGTVTLAEIKTDTHLGKTKNMIFEMLRINHTTRPEYGFTLGWSAKTPAIWIVWYAPFNNSVYTIRTENLRRAAQEYVAKHRNTSVMVDFTLTDNIKSTLNLLVPNTYWMKYTKIHMPGHSGNSNEK